MARASIHVEPGFGFLMPGHLDTTAPGLAAGLNIVHVMRAFSDTINAMHGLYAQDGGCDSFIVFSQPHPKDGACMLVLQVRLRGGDEALDNAERLLREFQMENCTAELPVGPRDEVRKSENIKAKGLR